MASVEECDAAFHSLADRLSASDPSKRTDLDRTLTCRLPDIGVIFAGHLHDGKLTDIRRVDDATAQVKLTMSSDDLIDLVSGRANFASAWASGRIKIDAGMFDLIKLRSVF
ncbi:MAG TPA: alkyl sulfatase C-terminal domain-containing protein [Jatrophihabitans sp.]|jgi:alkyl sulfatase BDS1-like metallo-beta-lactamase superfamily hydrolase